MPDLPFQRALVTGGAGFIGSHLVDALAARGCRVTVLDNLSTGSLANLAQLDDRIGFVQADIRDEGALAQAAGGAEVIFHQAAVVSVPGSVQDPVGSASVNEAGTLGVLDAARRLGVRRVVLASSCAVYGDDPDLPKHENLPPAPSSPYAVQKLCNELYARLFHRLYGLETVCLRYFNVYGPRQDPSSPYSGVISIFIRRALAGEAPAIHGDGSQSRDFVFVADVVRANLLAAASPPAAGSLFNVGTGEGVRIDRLWQLIADLSGSAAVPRRLPPRAGDVHASRAATRHAAAGLGFRSRFSLREGLEETIRWHTRS